MTPDRADVSSKEAIHYCLGIATKFKKHYFIGIGNIIASHATHNIVMPLLYASALAKLTQLHHHESLWSNFSGILIAYAIAVVAGQVFARLASWFEWSAALRSFAYAYQVSFRRLTSLGYNWHVDHSAGGTASSLNSFVWAYLEIFDNSLWNVIPKVVSVVAGVVILSIYAWPAAIALVAALVVYVFVLSHRMPRVVAAGQGFSNAFAEAEGSAADSLRNISAVLVAATEAVEEERVSGHLDDTVAADLIARSISVKTQAWISGTSSSMTWVALLVGVAMATSGRANAGAVYLVLFYTSTIADLLAGSFQDAKNIARSLGRIRAFVTLISAEPEIVDSPKATTLVVSSGTLLFRNLSFSYHPDQPLFRDFNLGIKAGEKVGIVGPSGSGKSTLTRLALRFSNLHDGEILIDGTDIAGVSQQSLRKAIAYVPQDPQMFHRSVAENIWYGQPGPPDMDRVIQAARDAHVDEFVMQLPDGYNTIVGERGLKLSGGQRQRISIAQATLKHAPLLILDEATSALDSHSEALVQDGLWRLMESCTALVIAHRLSTIVHMDRIVVVERGRITQSGTHKDLLNDEVCNTYRNLWNHQSGGFLAD